MDTSASAIDPLFTLYAGQQHHQFSKDASKRAALGIASDAAVNSVCFVGDLTATAREQSCDNNDDGDDDDNEVDDGAEGTTSLKFRCSDIFSQAREDRGRRQRPPRDRDGSRRFAATASADPSSSLFAERALSSCHADGSAAIWDLSTRRVVEEFCHPGDRGGAGLALRRIGSGSGGGRFLYQTRDPRGAVTLHDVSRPCDPIWRTDTYSQTFCQIAPCDGEGGECGGSNNLVALPSKRECFAALRDLRCDSSRPPAMVVHGASGPVGGGVAVTYDTERSHGMVTSLALQSSSSSSNGGCGGRLMLACGMESGTVFFHDLRATGRDDPAFVNSSSFSSLRPRLSPRPTPVVEETPLLRSFDYAGITALQTSASLKLGNDPVLCLDLVESLSHSNRRSESSSAKNTNDERTKQPSSASMVAISGCAGDADNLSSLPEEDRGTVAIMKISLPHRSTDAHRSKRVPHPAEQADATIPSPWRPMAAKIRARIPTCSVDHQSAGGKPGVSVCRFRPDGRVFAAGGWDGRLRIFGRTSGRPLAVLRGHDIGCGVTALDWADDAAVSGLAATGSRDGRICIWNVFPQSLKR